MLDCRSIHQLLNLASALLKVVFRQFPIRSISPRQQIAKDFPPLHYLLFILRTISYFLPLFRRCSLPAPSGCCLSLAGGRSPAKTIFFCSILLNIILLKKCKARSGMCVFNYVFEYVDATRFEL